MSGKPQGRHVSEVRLGNSCLAWSVELIVRHEDSHAIAGSTGGVRVGYTRVSTVAQTLDQQKAALEAAGVTEDILRHHVRRTR